MAFWPILLLVAVNRKHCVRVQCAADSKTSRLERGKCDGHETPTVSNRNLRPGVAGTGTGRPVRQRRLLLTPYREIGSEYLFDKTVLRRSTSGAAFLLRIRSARCRGLCNSCRE